MLPLSLHPRPVRAAICRLVSASSTPIALAVLFIALTVFITRDLYVTWDGVATIPDVPSCGDYCGTDAGLITGPAQ